MRNDQTDVKKKQMELLETKIIAKLKYSELDRLDTADYRLSETENIAEEITR